jgi:histidyl-tRNA synthetase
MREIKETCYKGTRILVGNRKRFMIETITDMLIDKGYQEIIIPIIQQQETFSGKVGEENNNMMYNLTDRGGRDLCLAPEYTAVVQKLATTTFKQEKDVKLFYVQECFRGEKPQAGRYRQFTQLGVEILNPTKDGYSANGYESYMEELISLTERIMNSVQGSKYEITTDVTRGLDYYKGGKGFEVSVDDLGSSKQVLGGGEYDGGIGFAIGIDRLLNCKKHWEEYDD